MKQHYMFHPKKMSSHDRLLKEMEANQNTYLNPVKLYTRKQQYQEIALIKDKYNTTLHAVKAKIQRIMDERYINKELTTLHNSELSFLIQVLCDAEAYNK